jgi:hypothetical protein
MFVTLWFELDYGINSPLGTLMTWQVHLRMRIWKCYVFAGKKGQLDRVTTSSKERMRSLVRVQVHDEITPKGGKDQCVTKERPQGLKCKDRTSCEKTPYLGREDDVAKMMQLKGSKCKTARGSTWRKGWPNRAEVGCWQLIVVSKFIWTCKRTSPPS